MSAVKHAPTPREEQVKLAKHYECAGRFLRQHDAIVAALENLYASRNVRDDQRDATLVQVRAALAGVQS